MNEIDILSPFYDEMKTRSVTRTEVYLSIDEKFVENLSMKLNAPLSLERAQRLADICIANEWLERTTIDPHYHYLSLTEAGLQIILLNRYS